MVFHTFGMSEWQARGKLLCLGVSTNAATGMCAHVCTREKKKKKKIKDRSQILLIWARNEHAWPIVFLLGRVMAGSSSVSQPLQIQEWKTENSQMSKADSLGGDVPYWPRVSLHLLPTPSSDLALHLRLILLRCEEKERRAEKKKSVLRQRVTGCF